MQTPYTKETQETKNFVLHPRTCLNVAGGNAVLLDPTCVHKDRGPRYLFRPGSARSSLPDEVVQATLALRKLRPEMLVAGIA